MSGNSCICPEVFNKAWFLVSPEPCVSGNSCICPEVLKLGVEYKSVECQVIIVFVRRY